MFEFMYIFFRLVKFNIKNTIENKVYEEEKKSDVQWNGQMMLSEVGVPCSLDRWWRPIPRSHDVTDGNDAEASDWSEECSAGL